MNAFPRSLGQPTRPSRFFRWTRLSTGVVLVASFLVGPSLWTPTLRAQYVYTKIVDNNDPVPGGKGALFAVRDQASFDGNGGVFSDANAPASIWLFALSGQLFRIVDLNTPVPGGVGNFTDVSRAIPVYRSGFVVFAGSDSNTNAPGNFHGGIYATNNGSILTKVVDYNTNIPGGTGKFTGGFSHLSLDAERIAFDGSGSDDAGVFAADTNAASLIAIADSNHKAHTEMTFPVGNFGTPVISAGTVLFFGNTTFDPSNGYNSLYTNPAGTSYHYDEIANSNQPLPGDATASFHTRYDEWRLDHGTAAFLADDPNASSSFFGLYTTPAAGGAFTKIVLNTTTLAGVGPISEFNQFALGGGKVVFKATDTSGNYGLFTANTNGSGLTKILSTGGLGPFADLGQPIGNQTGNTLNLGDNAAGDGSVVFRAFGGLYLATPASLAANLRTTLTHAPAAPAVGSTLTYTLTVTNAGTGSATNVLPSLALPAGLTFQSASGGGTFDAASSTVSFGNRGTFTPNQSATFTVVAGVNVAGTLTAGAYATSPTPDVNRNDNHAEDVALPTAPAANSPYVFIRIVDTNTAVPNQPGQKFALPNGSGAPPAVDASKVVFIASDANNNNLLWSANADGSGGLKLLAGPATVMPGGAGDKFASIQYARLRGGSAAFLGFGSNQHAGVFSVPVGGGAVTALVTQDTLRPEGTGTTFGYQGFIQSFNMGTLGDGQLGFYSAGGEYAYPVAGGMPRVLVYPNAQIRGVGNPSGYFAAPSLSGTRAVFAGNSGLLGTFLDERRYLAYVDAQTVVPGSGGSVSFDSFSNPQVEGDTLVFAGHSGGNPGVYGLYSISARARGGVAVKLVDTNTPVPGGTGSFSSFDTPEFGVNAGEVLFLGLDGNNRAGFYSVPAAGGAVRKIVTVGDSLGGTLSLAAINNGPAQPNSLGQHRIAFRADFSDSATNSGGPGIFVAVPGSLVTPVITSPATAAGTTGVAFSYQITASAGPTQYGVQGLPAGLAVNAGTGLITGAPNTAGTYTLTLNAYNAAGKGSKTLTLTVALGPPVITSAETAVGKVGTAFSYQIVASGSPTTYGVQGLPGGLTVNATTGMISGTPTKAGTYTLTLNAYNSKGKGSKTLTLTITAS